MSIEFSLSDTTWKPYYTFHRLDPDKAHYFGYVWALRICILCFELIVIQRGGK